MKCVHVFKQCKQWIIVYVICPINDISYGQLVITVDSDRDIYTGIHLDRYTSMSSYVVHGFVVMLVCTII